LIFEKAKFDIGDEEVFSFRVVRDEEGEVRAA
jgi:hypothetical protein